jgi:hypothetical protein
MPISLADLKKRTGRVDVYRALSGPRELWGKLNVEYLLNPDFTIADDLAKQERLLTGGMEAQGQDLADQAALMCVSWDLEDEEGNRVPIDSESIRDIVPLNILTDILNACAKDRTNLSPTKKR